MPKLLYMLLYIDVLGTLDKLKPSDIKGSSSLKWWSWGECRGNLELTNDPEVTGELGIYLKTQSCN